MNALLAASATTTFSSAKLGASDAIIFAALCNAKFEVKMCGRKNNLVAKWYQSVKHNNIVKKLLTVKVEKDGEEKEKSLMGTQGKRELKGF